MTEHFSKGLTLANWREWILNEEGVELDYSSKSAYFIIRGSSTLREDFLFYPDTLKRKVFYQISNGTNVDTVTTAANLSIEANNEHPSHLWFLNHTPSIIAKIRKLTILPNSDFIKEAQLFNEIYKVTDSPSDPAATIPWLLMFLYDGEKVTEVLRRCRESGSTVSTENILFLVENWWEWRDYPVQWSLSLLKEDSE